MSPPVLRYRLAAPWLALHRAWRPLRRGAGRGFRILLFHDVPESRWDAFRRLLDLLRRDHGILDPAAAEAWIGGQAEDRRGCPCLLSFDDGFASNGRLAREVLEPAGVRALFFLCPGLMDIAGDEQAAAVAANMFRGNAPDDLESLLTWDEAAALAEAGHVLGAHGLTHRRLVDLSPDDRTREVTASGDRLAERLGRAVDWFAFPFGDIDSVNAAVLRDAGGRYRFCRSGVRGLNGTRTHPLALRADHMDLAAPEAYWRLVLEGGLDRRYRDAGRRLAAWAGDSSP